MSGTTNLNIPLIQQNQNQKEVTANDAFQKFDDALTNSRSVSVASGNAAPTAADVRTAFRLLVTGATAIGRTVELPILEKPTFVTSDPANTRSISVVRGTKSFILFPGASALFFTDGTANGLFRLSEQGPDRNTVWVRGAPAANEIVMRQQVQEDSVLLPDLLGWDMQADVAATAITVFDVRKNGVSVGTLTFAAAGTVPTYATTANAAVSFSAGDFIDVKSPAVPDVTLSDFFIYSILIRS